MSASIYASRELYAGTGLVPGRKNRGIIGWHSVVGPGDITISPEAMEGEHDPSIMWAPDDYSHWRSAGAFSPTSFSCYINLLNTGQNTIDYVALTGHNFADNETGQGYSYSLEYSEDGESWAELVAPRIALDGSSILFQFAELSVFYCRIKITSQAWAQAPGRSAATFAVAHLRMGKLLRLQRPMLLGMVPFTLDTESELESGTSDNGKYLGGRLVRVWERYTITQGFVDPLFVRQHIKPFLNHCRMIGGGSRGPAGSFFALWRPDDYPEEVLYCHAPSRIRNPENQLANGMMQFSLSGTASR